MTKKQIINEQKVTHVKRERNILDRLQHQSIVQLLFSFQDQHTLYLGMELIPGGEILDQIRARKGFDEETTRFYAAEMVECLEYLKSQSVVHRDFKPENVLLCADGHIKLVDFGSAKCLDTESHEDQATGESSRSYSFVGTAEYISPEVLTSMPASYAADHWALGCIIYQMQANIPPFKGASEYLTFQLIQNREFTFPNSVSRQARSLIDGLLTLDPNHRLGSRTEGLQEVKSHPFFKSIPWGCLRSQEAPPRFSVPPERDQPNDAMLPEIDFDTFDQL